MSSPFVYRHAFPITPSDTADLPMVAQAISFTNSGAQTIQVTMLGDANATPLGVLPTGKYDNMQIKRVWATNTSVTGIVGYAT